MNSTEILEVLGNESRRRILELLSKKPCYISEISYSLKMAPKVVLEHLDKLEKAGIISSFEDGRRRYYYINENIRLEVVISPHKFSINVQRENGAAIDPLTLFGEIKEALKSMEQIRAETLSELYRALKVSEELHSRFARAQNMLEVRFNEFLEKLLNEIESIVKDDFERFIMFAIAKGMRRTAEIAECFRLPYREVEKALNSLMRRGLVKREFEGGEYIWVIK